MEVLVLDSTWQIQPKYYGMMILLPARDPALSQWETDLARVSVIPGDLRGYGSGLGLDY